MVHPFLRTTSMLWFVMLAAVFVMMAAGLVWGEYEPDISLAFPITLVAAFGVGSVVTAQMLERTLAATPPADAEGALGQVQARSMVQWNLGLAPSVLALAMSIAIGPAWLVLIAMVLSLVVLIPTRPSMSRLERLDNAWAEQGAGVDMVEHLREYERTHPRNQ